MFKKNIVVLSAFMLLINFCNACELCTIYMGISPHDYANSFGMRYRYNLFEKVNKAFNGNSAYSDFEEYNNYDVYGNFYINHRLQFNFNTSFSDNYEKENDSIITNIGGLGDVTLLLKYQLFNSKKSNDTIIKNKLIYRLSIATGIILPTGNYNKNSITGFQTKPTNDGGTTSVPETEIDPHLQPGTGSFGYLLLTEYLVKFNSIGINLNASYRMNSTNKNEFRFANRFNSNIALFSLIKIKTNIKLMPQLGLSYEKSKRDQFQNQPFMESGGTALLLNSGINLFINKLSIGIDYYYPVYQNLFDNQPLNKQRMVYQITYYF